MGESFLDCFRSQGNLNARTSTIHLHQLMGFPLLNRCLLIYLPGLHQGERVSQTSLVPPSAPEVSRILLYLSKT